MKPERMILRGGLFLFCLSNELLDILGVIWAWQVFFSFSVVLFLLFTTLSLVPSLLDDFPSAFGNPSDEKEENKHQGSCNHTGLSRFAAAVAPWWLHRCPVPSSGPSPGRGWGWHCQRMGQEIICCAKMARGISPSQC